MTENAKESTKKPFYKRVWVWALVIVLAVGAYAAMSKAGIGGGGTTSFDGTGTKAKQKEPAKKATYDLTDVKLTGPDELKTYKVTGKLKNLASDKKTLVFVNYKLKDKDGTLLDTLTAYAPSIGPGETWSFSTSPYVVVGGKQPPASFELEEVKGF